MSEIHRSCCYRSGGKVSLIKKLQRLEVEIKERKEFQSQWKTGRGGKTGHQRQVYLVNTRKKQLKSESGELSHGLDKISTIHFPQGLLHRLQFILVRLFPHTSAIKYFFKLHYIDECRIKLCSEFIFKLPDLFF